MNDSEIRKAFEAEGIYDYTRHHNTPNIYAKLETRIAWVQWKKGWQAALSSQPRVTEEELDIILFETNQARNPALEWHHAAVPKKKYRSHAKALATKLPHIVKHDIGAGVGMRRIIRRLFYCYRGVHFVSLCLGTHATIWKCENCDYWTHSRRIPSKGE